MFFQKFCKDNSRSLDCRKEFHLYDTLINFNKRKIKLFKLTQLSYLN